MHTAGSRRLVFAVCIMSQFFAACARKEPVPDAAKNPVVVETIETTSQALNPNPQVADFGLYATNSLSVQSSVVVNGGDIGVKNTGAGPFLVTGFEIAIGGSSVISTAKNVIGDSVQLGSSSVVGSVQTNQLQNLGGVHGTVTPFVAMPAMPSVATVTAGTTDRIIANNTVTTLPAAATYRNLTIGNQAIVRLTGGIYNVAQVTLGQNSRIEALAAAEIHVAGRISVGTSSTIGPASGTTLTARHLRVEVSGINGTTGALTATPPAASFAGTNQVRALIIVPNGLLTFGSSSVLQGAMFGRDVKVSASSSVTYQDGFSNPGCPASCDDANPCTTDACVSNACTHTPLANGTACSDGNACNGAEACNASGTCVAGTPPVVDDGNPCTTDACMPATGVTHTPVATGTSCTDNNACNGAEACNASGTCVAGTPPVVDDGNPCTTDACTPATGVTHTPVATGTSCMDNNACNGAEACNASGTCVTGTPPAVDDGNPCTTDACTPATGVTHTPVAAGTSCSDGNACNGPETCNAAAACQAGVPPVIDDGNPCTADTCDPLVGVVHLPAPGGTSCSDGNACNGAEICDASGSCTAGTAVTCTAQDQCHTVGTCEPATGACSNPAKANGTTCTDGNACTATDTCQAGTCTGTGSVATDDNNPCTTDACDPAGGVTHTPVASGTSCTDGNTCNGAETCNGSGTCVAGTAPPVDDNNPCTTDSCDPATGVQHAPVAAGTMCTDGNACNGAEICDASGSCTAGTAVTCTAQDQCHAVGTCDTTTGACSNPVRADGTACTDGDACTATDICQAGTCTGTGSVLTDDNNPCTTDACDPAGGVTHTPVTAGTSCTDGNACNGAETCDASGSCSAGTAVTCTAQDQCHTAGTCEPATGACSNPAKVDGTTCTDGNACTATDTCQAGTCMGTGSVATDDNNPCTTDACDPAGGVTHTPVASGTSCTDGNACNGAETCDASGSCSVGTAVTCTAQDQCHTAGTCEPATGACSNPTKADGATCDDSNACTQSDACQTGTCVGTSPVNCPTPAACHTQGTCDPANGLCSNPSASDGTACDDSNTCTQTDTCQAGSCIGGSPVGCTPTDSCHQAGTCDPGSGLCSNPTAPDGTTCSSGNACQTSETCQSGTCQGGTSVAIDDGNPCTLDTCDSTNGVVHHACTAINRTVGTNLNDASGFIHTGANPVQTGVAPGTIVPSRVVVLRGHVFNRAGAPLPGAAVTIADHPEFGITHTQGDGGFDMVVNGGHTFRVLLQRGGYLPAERTVVTPWQEYAPVPDVFMLQVDPQVTTVDLAAATDIQVARGSVSNDIDGARQATLLVKPGTQAVMTLPNNSTVNLETVHMRATEYTVGVHGPEAMPAALPPTSAYTYAMELSLDEALNAGATDVTFSQPLPFYVENFLHFPVGESVPAGYFDRKKGAWVASENGRIVKILSVTAGMADLDVTGDDAADTGSALSSLGIDDAERERLAGMYVPGQSLWRIPIAHFSPWDANWGFFPPETAKAPDGEPELADNGDGAGKCPPQIGSLIDCQGQALGEEVGIIGTPFKLHYRSDRQAGRRPLLKIPLSGLILPGPVKRIDLIISVAGRYFRESFPATTNLSTTFLWDGKDAYGRAVQGRQPIGVKVGNVYKGIYKRVDQFSKYPTGDISADEGRLEITLWKDWRSFIGNWDSKPQGLGGFNLTAHHAYDTEGREIVYGDGSKRSPAFIPTAIKTIVGHGISANTGDGGFAKLANIRSPESIAIGPEGSVYIADGTSCIRRIAPDNGIERFAGDLFITGFAGDGGPAVSAIMHEPTDVAVGPDGSLYIADKRNHRIRRIDSTGIIQTVVGNPPASGSSWLGTFSGDGGPATLAGLNRPTGIDVAADGTLFILDSDNSRVRMVTPDGIIQTVAGNGPGACLAPVVGPAVNARLCFPGKVRVAADGAFYVNEINGEMVRRVGTDGIIRPFAGNGGFGYSGDGGPAIAAQLRTPMDIALDRDGSVYIVDQNRTVRMVDPSGIISTVVGDPSRATFIGDDGPAAAAGIAVAHGLRVGLNRDLYIADTFNNRVRVVAPPLPGFTLASAPYTFPSEDGSVIDLFDGTGRHTETRDALTNASLYRFTYDSGGRLATVTDVDDNVTQIDHDPAGNPSGITGPYGQVTTLHVDANGYLDTITNPASDVTRFTHSTDGLMATMTDPRTNAYQFTYDEVGRLKRDDDPAGGFKTLTRTDLAKEFSVEYETKLGRKTKYKTERLNTGTTRRTNTLPNGLQSTFSVTRRGTMTSSRADGTGSLAVDTPDPRFGMLSPLRTFEITAPSGLARGESMTRLAAFSGGGSTLSTLTERQNVNGNVWVSIFDTSTRTWTTTSPAGRKLFVALDSKGHRSSTQIDGLDAETLNYDPRGRLSTLTQGARTWTFTHGSDGMVLSATNPMTQTTQFDRDLAGRLTSEIAPDTATIGRTYDRAGNVTSLTPSSRPAHAMTYTPVNILGTYEPPVVPGSGSTNTTYASDFDRFLAQVVRPDNQTVVHGYDSFGRPSTVTLPTGTISYGYHPATGNLTTVNGPAGESLTFSYDGLLLTDVVYDGQVAGAVHSTFDTEFRVASETVNGSFPATFTYDTDGVLVQAGSLTLTSSPTNGLLSSTTLGSVTDSYGYNSYGEVTAHSAQYQGSTILSEAYTRDLLGRIHEQTETVSGTTHVYGYTYDLRGRLGDVTVDGLAFSHYDYDANSNRIARVTPTDTTTATYDAQDRLLTYGSITYSYGANGELSTKTDAATGQVTSYVYDGQGALTRVLLPGGPTIDYVIDGLGRRVGKSLNGTLAKGFLYSDMLRIAAELDGAGAVVSRFVYASRANVPAYMIRGGGTYRIVTDDLGSVRAVVNVADGTVAQRLEYGEFGAVTVDTAPGFQPFGFAGGLYDPDTGLVRFSARDYDPFVGRWTAKDPILFRGKQTNLYLYAAGDPINRIDPSGKWGFYCGGGVGAALGYFLSAGGDVSGGVFIDLSSKGVAVGGYSSRSVVAGLGLYVSAGGEAGFFSSLDAFKGYSTIGKVDLGLVANGAITSGAAGGNDSGFIVGTSLTAGGGLFAGGGVSNTDILGYQFGSAGGHAIY